MTPEQLEASRIISLFPILNQRGHMINTLLAKTHIKDVIEILKSGNTIEFYEQVLKQLEDGKAKNITKAI